MNHYDLDKMYCGHIKRGEIFLVELNHEEKLVAVIQDNILNERLSTILAIPIELHHEGALIFRNELLLKPSETSLERPTVCLPHKLQAIDRRLFLAKTGELNKERLENLYAVLDINLGRFRDIDNK